MKIGKHETHPIADAYPLMSEHRLASLVDDIDANGQRLAVTLFEGRILDGRNRYLACVKLGIEPRFDTFEGDEDEAIRFVVSMNHERRDLDDGQRALAVRRLAKQLDRIRKAKNESQPALPGVSDEHAGMAEKLEQDGAPELVEAVEKGVIPLHAAAAVAELDEDEQRKMVKRIGKAEERETQRAKKRDVTVVSEAIRLSPVEVAALKALALAGDAHRLPEVREGAKALRRIVPGIGR